MSQSENYTTKPDNPHRDKEGTRTMGASRDFTTGPDGAGTGRSTALLEQGRRTTPLPSRTPHRTAVPTRKGRDARGNRLGSKQVVSFRGRQLHQPVKKSSLFPRLSVVAIVLLIVGVIASMWLSGISTAQTFRVQQLTAQESDLSNQLETLHRDLENIRSASDVARRANEAKMGVPIQPGVVEIGSDGHVTQKREATPEAESVIDVNGDPVRPGQASSDPNKTADVSNSLNAVPNTSANQNSTQTGQQGAANQPATGNQEQAHTGAPEQADPNTVELPNIPAQTPYAARG